MIPIKGPQGSSGPPGPAAQGAQEGVRGKNPTPWWCRGYDVWTLVSHVTEQDYNTSSLVFNFQWGRFN